MFLLRYKKNLSLNYPQYSLLSGALEEFCSGLYMSFYALINALDAAPSLLFCKMQQPWTV